MAKRRTETNPVIQYSTGMALCFLQNGVIGKFVYPGLQTDPTPNAGSIQTEGNRASRLELAELTALHRRP
jgi:hypothetical protein